MQTISKHEFLADNHGGLTLLLNIASLDEPRSPVLLVSRYDDKAYLRRAPDDIYEIVRIHPHVIERVRTALDIVVIEMLGQKVVHSYDVPTAILEEEENALAMTGTDF